MTSTWFGLETARRGMMVNQRALDIIGHNLANASTEGYSRQEAVINPTEPFTEPALDSWVTVGQLGTGVEVSSIRRVKDEYLDNNVRRCTTDSSYWEEQLNVLQLAEASIAEPASDGIGDRITDFFTSWMNLNNNPQDSSVKAAVVESGDSLASLLSYTYNQLNDVQDSIAVIDATPAVAGGKISDQVGEVNDLLVQIQDLTDSIVRVYDVGQQPNDLLDQRDMLLEELSQYGPVSVTFETVNGMPTGELSEFNFLGLDVSQAGTSFSLTTDGADISLAITGGADDGSTINLTGSAFDANLGGSILGLERARQNVLDYMSKLDDLASNMESMIAGVGVNFFSGDLSAGDFSVDSAILLNPSLIDGTLAGDVADLRDVQINPPAQPYTFEQYYGLLVTEVGSDVKVAGDMYDNQSAIKDQITSLRDSVSGVSTDEELTKMMQFEYGFQACARMVTVLDGMLDLLINGLID
ncbi:flagellar hook-associated protein FlgK [Pelotomaculum propionicicum]|uniref:flagellar hook-associated protein FlgK n=1 Tax=Pelotomaculum propionicicum TaxID=258475 RepID=UPI003B7818F6